MSQTTYAVMYAVKVLHLHEKSIETWREACETFNVGRKDEQRVCIETIGGTTDLVGFTVAAGASGRAGCPDLDQACTLSGFLDVPDYNGAYLAAKTAWADFVKWLDLNTMLMLPLMLPEPQLWLCQVEVR